MPEDSVMGRLRVGRGDGIKGEQASQAGNQTCHDARDVQTRGNVARAQIPARPGVKVRAETGN